MLELLYYIQSDVNETKLQMIGMLTERFQLTQSKDWQFFTTLGVAMMTTYQLHMAGTLQHLAYLIR